MTRLVFHARLRHLASDEGGRTSPIYSGYRPSWNLGNTWLGDPTLDDGQVLFDGDAIAPGQASEVRMEPLTPESWGEVRTGSLLEMQEGRRVVGYATILGIASRPEWLTRETAAFVVQARQFCAHVDRASQYALPDRLAATRLRILELYRAGVGLPDVVVPDSSEAPRVPDPQGWPGFDEREHYWQIFDPYGNDRTAVCGSLSDDVLDIYRDVSCGLASWDASAQRTALWHWRFHLDAHWGAHAVNALRALHWAR